MAKIIEALKAGERQRSAPLDREGHSTDTHSAEILSLAMPSNDARESDSSIRFEESVIDENRAQPPMTEEEEIPTTTIAEEELAGDPFFIEVGGPDRQVWGSPEVLGSSVTPGKKDSATKETAPKTMSFQSLETSRPIIEFQPWPCPDDNWSSQFPPELVVFHKPDDPVSEQYGQLVDKILETTAKGKVLLFTRRVDSEDTTTALLNLAIAAVQRAGKKVVVADKNWIQPKVAERLGLPPVPGLQEALSGQIALETALRKTPLPQLQILTSGEITGHESCLGSSEALRWIVRRLSNQYDLILLDAPAWQDNPEFASLLSVSDGIYPIVQETHTSQKQLQHMIKDMTQAGGKVRGVIYYHPPLH